MFNMTEKIILSGCGVVLTGCAGVAIYLYGEIKYLDGRIDKHGELFPVMKTMQKELNRFYDQEKEN